MTSVMCGAECIYSKDYKCTKDEIEMSIEGCESFVIYPQEDDPEYQNEYWICAKKSDGNRVRRKRTGKKYEFDGLTFYTGDDIRYGVKGAFFTEEKTGIGVRGEHLTEQNMAKIHEIVDSNPPVTDYPVEKE